MKELNIMEATVLTSPNPLTLICSIKEDGSTNLAPICFVSYLSFNPPMVGFATSKQSHTGKQVLLYLCSYAVNVHFDTVLQFPLANA